VKLQAAAEEAAGGAAGEVSVAIVVGTSEVLAPPAMALDEDRIILVTSVWMGKLEDGFALMPLATDERYEDMREETFDAPTEAEAETVGFGGAEDADKTGFPPAATEDVGVSVAEGSETGFRLADAEAVVVGAPAAVPGAEMLAGRLVQWRVLRVRREVTVARGGLEELGVDVGFAVETVTLPEGLAPLIIACNEAVLIFALVTTIFPSIVMVTGWARLNRARQPRLSGPRLAANRCARKVYRSTATSGAGLALPVKSCLLPWMKIPDERKFLQ
jgi:hypothetical protein